MLKVFGIFLEIDQTQNILSPYTPFRELLSNGLVGAIYLLILAFLIFTIIRIALKWKSVRLPKYLAFIMGTVLLWSASSIIRFITGNEYVIYVYSFLPYAFATLSITTVLLFIIRFHYLSSFDRPVFLMAFLVFPLMTLANIILGLFEMMGAGFGINLIRVSPYVSAAEYGHLNYVFGNHGPWHYVVNFTNLAIAVGIVIVAVVQHLSIPKIYRAPSEKLMTGTMVVATGSLVQLLMNVGPREILPFDFGLIFFVISIRFFYSATLGTQGLIFLSQARNDVIQNIDQSILFLNEDQKIIFTNKHAADWLKKLHFTGTDFNSLLECLEETASLSEKLHDEEGGTDYHFEPSGKKVIYNLRMKPILDKKKRQIGMYVVYTDVTENRELIRRLEVGAGRDVLTGLNNRAMMESLKRELDNIENLPLAVIIADLNDLKKTNDGHGHLAGDIMLRVCGEALSEKCPPTAQVGRIGGDEFLILLPKTGKMEAEAIMNSVREYLSGINDYPYRIVMAMGCGVKSSAGENLSKIMEDADKAMYADKKSIKGGAEIRNTETMLI
jgi:diguanylate cyclase (GGDEF)-like protein